MKTVKYPPAPSLSQLWQFLPCVHFDGNRNGYENKNDGGEDEENVSHEDSDVNADNGDDIDDSSSDESVVNDDNDDSDVVPPRPLPC